EVRGYRFTFDGAHEVGGPNYTAIRGTFTVSSNGRTIATLTPERRSYSQPPDVTTEAAIHTTFYSDLYAVIGDAAGDGAFVTRIYCEPFVPFIWYGVLLMGLAGLVSLSDRRLRVGAPQRRASLAPAE